MRAIVNRRIYDTEKSQLLARTTLPTLDAGLRAIEEALYKSPNLGHLFIYRADSREFGFAPEHTIRLVSEDEALEWLLEHDLVNDEMYEKMGIQLEEA